MFRVVLKGVAEDSVPCCVGRCRRSAFRWKEGRRSVSLCIVLVSPLALLTLLFVSSLVLVSCARAGSLVSSVLPHPFTLHSSQFTLHTAFCALRASRVILHVFVSRSISYIVFLNSES